MAVKKLGDLIKSLATKMKLKLDDEKLKPLFELDTPVEEEFANAFEQQLMTEEAALANPKIRGTIKAESLNGLDAVLEEVMTSFEFPDDLKAEMKKADTSFKRTKLVAEKIAELKEEKLKATLPADKKAIQKEIDDLNNTFAEFKKTSAKEKDDLIAAQAAKTYNMALAYKLQGKKYYDSDTDGAIPVNVHATTAQTLLTQALAKDGADLIFDEASQTWKILNKETKTEYHNTNQQKVTADEYIDGVLADNKLLKTSKAGEPPAGPKTPTVTPGADTKQTIPSMSNAIDRQLEG